MTDRVLILTPMKNAARHLDQYFANLSALAYPASHLSLGFLVSDSTDDTWLNLEARLSQVRQRFHDVNLVKRDFGFQLPPGVDRWSPAYQMARRSVLARSRNHLLFAALADEDWVLWLDADVTSYPPNILQLLLSTEKKVVHPHCVVKPGGRTFDGNSWLAGGTKTMYDMRGSGPIRLEGVGGTMLLVHADIHRDGLVFPTFPYGVRSHFIRQHNPMVGEAGGEIETEGLAIMAKDMGHEVWGLPDVEIVHAAE